MKNKINEFIDSLEGQSQIFFKNMIKICRIEEMLDKSTFEQYLFKIMAEEEIRHQTIEVTASIYMKMLQDFCDRKICHVDDIFYLLEDKGWQKYDTITKNGHYWYKFIDLCVGTAKIPLSKKTMILNLFIKMLQRSNYVHDVIQLNNQYIYNGVLYQGKYDEGFARVTIDRMYEEENNDCSYAKDLLLHLSGGNENVRDWFLNQIASVLILNSEFKTANAQLVRLYGPTGENGKSTLTNFLKKVFGMKNVYSTKVDLLMSEFKYDLGNVVNSLIVVDEDASECYYKADVASLMKVLVTGETLSVREIYGKPVQRNPICNIFVSSNHPYKSDDKTDGANRRITEIKINGKLRRDKEWFNKLFSDKECKAFFNLCMEKAKELMINFRKGMRIELPEELKVRKTELAKDNNNVLIFIEEQGDFIENYSTAEVRKNYELWCIDNDFNPLGKTKFNETIETKLELVARSIKGSKLKGDAYDRSLVQPRFNVRAWVKAVD